MIRMVLRALGAACMFVAPVAALAFSSTPSGNATTFSGFSASAGNIGRYAVSTASDGTVLVNSGARLNLAGGGSIPINVTGSIPKASAAAAVGRFLGKSLPLLGAGVALYELAQELGYNVDNSSGSVVVTKPTQVDPTYYDAFEYQYSDSGWKHSAIAACNDWIAAFSGTGFSWSAPTFTAPSTCRADRTTISNGGTFPQTQTIARRNQLSAPPPPPVLPSTPQAFADAIAAKSGWPTSSALAPTIADAIRAGEVIGVQSPVVTGPATAPVSTTTKVDPATGNTTTDVCVVSNTFSGPTVTTSTTCTATVTNTSTGAPVGQPTVTTAATPVTPTTEAPTEPAPFAMPCGIAGTPPCAVKVDETGTPTTVAELTNPQTRGQEVTAPIDPVVSNPQGFWPSLPTLSWAFSLPSGCSVIALPAFSPWLPAVDVCEFQPMFHDLMTVVWSVGALLGLVSLFWRNVFAGVAA